jgi:hypothetical protein
VSRAVLVLLGLAATGLGLASLLRPVEMAAMVELPLPSAASRTDVRAIYGGVVAGIGVFLLTCALRRGMVRTGLAAAACVFGGAALARFFGLSIEGFGQPLMLITALLETVAAGLAIWGAIIEPGLTRIGSSRPSPSSRPAEASLDSVQGKEAPALRSPRPIPSPDQGTRPPEGPSV